MRLNRILWILFIGIVVGACSQELPVKFSDKKGSEHETVSDKISLDEALCNANALFNKIEGGTRSSERRVNSVEYLCGAKTRSSADNDTMYYLVNYADDSGFAVLSANRNTAPVFAISQEGQLNVEDTIDNKGLAYFFRGLDSLASLAPVLEGNSITPVTPVNPFDSITNIKDFNTPKLPKSVQQWPGNQLSPLHGKYANVVISISQAMTYFKKPLIWTSWLDPYSKRSLNWNLISSYAFTSSSLISDPGVIEIEALLSSVGDALVYWEDFGYYMMKEFGEKYGYEIKQLYSPPMNVGGHDHQEPLDSDAECWKKAIKEDRIIVSLDAAHGFEYANEIVSWVVDGYISYAPNSYSQLVKYNTDTMFHCVWGRGSNCNGYYAFMADTKYFITNPIVKDSNYLDYDMPLDSIVKALHYTFRAK